MALIVRGWCPSKKTRSEQDRNRGRQESPAFRLQREYGPADTWVSDAGFWARTNPGAYTPPPPPSVVIRHQMYSRTLLFKR